MPNTTDRAISKSVVLDQLNQEEKLGNQSASIVVLLNNRQALPILKLLLSNEESVASYDAERNEFFVTI